MQPRYLLPLVAILLALLTACTTADVASPAQPPLAAKLSFTVQPSDATAGTAIVPAVTIQDASGQTVSTATSAVTVAIGANPGGGTLFGTTTVNPVNGVASFPGLSIDKAGGGYTLVASSVPLTSATSVAFTITSAPAAKLVFIEQPTSTSAGVTITPAAQAAIQDAFGNTVPTAANAVTVAIDANPGGGTLFGTTTVNPVNGMASFPGLSIDKAGSGYTLVASSVPLTSATSETFSVAPGPVASVWVNPGAAILNWVTGPNTVQLRATAVDAHGNTVPTTVTWSSSDPAAVTVDATGFVVGLGGTATITASTGGQTGTATIAAQCGLPRCSGMPSVSFSQLPGSAKSGAVFVVQVSFPACAFCSNWSGVVSIAIGNNPTGATLTGNTDQSVSRFSGATWSSLRVDKPGIGYTLVAIVQSSSVSGGVFGHTSSSFNITQ